MQFFVRTRSFQGIETVGKLYEERKYLENVLTWVIPIAQLNHLNCLRLKSCFHENKSVENSLWRKMKRKVFHRESNCINVCNCVNQNNNIKVFKGFGMLFRISHFRLTACNILCAQLFTLKFIKEPHTTMATNTNSKKMIWNLSPHLLWDRHKCAIQFVHRWI